MSRLSNTQRCIISKDQTHHCTYDIQLHVKKSDGISSGQIWKENNLNKGKYQR